MRRLFALLSATLLIGLLHPAHAGELASFLQTGDAFCPRETDFDGLAARGAARQNSPIETCLMVDRPTRVAIIGGQAKLKTMVRVMSGPYAYTVGWTNGALPLAR